jgi:hypothetical protein
MNSLGECFWREGMPATTEKDKHTLYRRTKRKDEEEVFISNGVIKLVWVILAFILVLLGRSIFGFFK